MAENAINPDAPSPWVMCPECACTWVRVLCVLEKGEWGDDGEYRPRDAPRATALVLADNGSALECNNCGHTFDGYDPEEQA